MAEYKVKKGINSNQYRANRANPNRNTSQTKTNNKTRRNDSRKRKSKIREALPWIIVGAVGVALVGGKMKQRVDADAMIRKANLDVPRSFNNIDEEKMGKYLKNQIKVLYSKYPEVDDWVYEETEETTDEEFIRDIYTLYKAYLVDEKDKEVEDIDDTRITIKNQYIFTPDVLSAKMKVKNWDTGEKEEKYVEITETNDEKNKIVTDAFVEITDEEEGSKDGALLARRMYELLAKKIGLKEKVATSVEINEQIKENGFYYDALNETFYTEVGEATLVNNKDLEELNEKSKKIAEYEHEQEKKFGMSQRS